MKKTQILIVEDNRIVAEDIQNRLENLQYEVSGIVSSGERAIASVRERQPDLILMDIVLKGEMDGIDAASQILTELNVPVIYLTACAHNEILERAKVTEPFGYIIKPFQDRELASVIEVALYKHKMENKLRESEQRFATTLKSIGDAVISTDTQGNITFMNPVAESLTGWHQGDALGKSLKDIFNIVNEESRKPVENPVDKVIREGNIVGLANHTVLISKNGSEIPIDDSGSPIRDENGNINGVVLICRDISERKINEDA